jgi:hypothetical protein
MANTQICPQCNEPVDTESPECPHYSALLPAAGLGMHEPTSSQQTEPIHPPSSGHLSPGVHVTVNNDLTPLLPANQKPHQQHRHTNPWWIVAFAALGIILMLGATVLLVHQPTAPVSVVHPTATPLPPTLTATALPQVRVVIQLDDVQCVDTRDFFRADGFYIKSSFSAPSVDGRSTITMNKTTIHYNVNNGDTADFNVTDRVVFDANIPLSGVVSGSLTAYTDNDSDTLGTTSLEVSAEDSTHSSTWHITGRSFLNTWEEYVHYSISLNRVDAGPSVNAAILREMSSGTAGSQALDIPSARRWKTEHRIEPRGKRFEEC